MNRFGWAAVALILVAALASGCSGETGADQSEPFPPRPADISLDGVPACQALSDEQRAQIGAGRGRDGAEAATSDICLWKSEDNRFWDVRLQPQNPIAQFDPRDPLYIGNEFGYRDPQITSVDGYGAVRFGYGLGADPFCDLALDVGPSSSVVVGFGNNPARSPRFPAPLSFEQRCAEATRVASMVLTTLRSRATG